MNMSPIIIPQSHANFAQLLPSRSRAMENLLEAEDDITKDLKFTTNDRIYRSDVNMNNCYNSMDSYNQHGMIPRGKLSSLPLRNEHGFCLDRTGAIKSSTLPNCISRSPKLDRKIWKSDHILNRVAQQMQTIISDLKTLTLKREKRIKLQNMKHDDRVSIKVTRDRVENEYDMNLIPQRMGHVTGDINNQLFVDSVTSCRKYESSFNPQTSIISSGDDDFAITPDRLRKVARDNHETQNRLSCFVKSPLISRHVATKTSSLKTDISNRDSRQFVCSAQVRSDTNRIIGRRRSLDPNFSSFAQSIQGKSLQSLSSVDESFHDSNTFSDDSRFGRSVFQRRNGSLVRRNSSKLSSCTRSSSYRRTYIDDEHIYETIPGDESYILWNGDTPLFTRRQNSKNIANETKRASIENTSRNSSWLTNEYSRKDGVALNDTRRASIGNSSRNILSSPLTNDNSHTGAVALNIRIPKSRLSPPLPDRPKRYGMKTYRSMETLTKKTSKQRHRKDRNILDTLNIDDHYETIRSIPTSPLQRYFNNDVDDSFVCSTPRRLVQNTPIYVNDVNSPNSFKSVTSNRQLDFSNSLFTYKIPVPSYV